MTDIDNAPLPTILAVDDTPDNLTLISELLKPYYRVKAVINGAKALEVARGAEPPDLILLDIMMPGMDGYEVCAQLKSDPRTAGIPIIFLTAMSGVEDEKRGLDLGAADYITKPISPPITLARVRTQLQNKQAADFLRDQNSFLETEVRRRMQENDAIQDMTILALAGLAENRDAVSNNRIMRTRSYVRVLCGALKSRAPHNVFLTPNNIQLIARTAPLHNIGEVGIPDRIRLNPAPLSQEDREVFKTHTRIARDVLARAAAGMKADAPFLQLAQQMAYSHHERWDGFGYPEGLAGEDIPLAARIVAVADAYDELVFPGIYQEPSTHERAVEAVRARGGSLFDPLVIDAFEEVGDLFRQIALRLADSERDRARRIHYIEQAIAEQA
ncbi:MAG TPA: HD domain-containing phosphohydrolase [Ramlibacter sp.]|nr:HD domain-containing phosphohydrolase [Ramlibacter sp.]